MPIALYRHKKLVVARPLAVQPTIMQFSDKRIRNLVREDLPDGSVCVTIYFSHRMRGTKRWTHDMTREMSWKFHKNKFIMASWYLTHITSRREEKEIPPLVTFGWTANGLEDTVNQRIQQGIASRCIIEEHLHEHYANPFDYMITVFDFNPDRTDDQPFMNSYPVRSLEECQAAANEDQSDSPKQWFELLVGKS